MNWVNVCKFWETEKNCLGYMKAKTHRLRYLLLHQRDKLCCHYMGYNAWLKTLLVLLRQESTTSKDFKSSNKPTSQLLTQVVVGIVRCLIFCVKYSLRSEDSFRCWYTVTVCATHVMFKGNSTFWFIISSVVLTGFKKAAPGSRLVILTIKAAAL